MLPRKQRIRHVAAAARTPIAPGNTRPPPAGRPEHVRCPTLYSAVCGYRPLGSVDRCYGSQAWLSPGICVGNSLVSGLLIAMSLRGMQKVAANTKNCFGLQERGSRLVQGS